MQALLFDKVRSKKILLWERRDLCKMTNPKANLLLTFHEARVSLHSTEMRVKVLYTGALQSSSHFAVDKVQRSWQEGVEGVGGCWEVVGA